MLLSRDQILATKLPFRDVEIAELGTFRLQSFSVATRVAAVNDYLNNLKAVQAYADDQALQADERKGVEPVREMDDYAIQLIHALVDEAGAPLFTIADYDWFTTAIPYRAVELLWSAFKELNIAAAVTEEAIEEDKPVDKRSRRKT